MYSSLWLSNADKAGAMIKLFSVGAGVIILIGMNLRGAYTACITMLWAGYFVLILEMVMPTVLVGLSMSFIAKSTAILIKSFTSLFL